MDVLISGETIGQYMGIEGIKAQHVTLMLANSPVRQEIQLMRYIHPDSIADPHINDLNKLGYNHVCFAVDDIEAEVEDSRRMASSFVTKLWTSIAEN